MMWGRADLVEQALACGGCRPCRLSAAVGQAIQPATGFQPVLLWHFSRPLSSPIRCQRPVEPPLPIPPGRLAPPQHSIHRQPPPIRSYCNQTVKVGPQHCRTSAGEPRQYVAMRMPEGVFESVRDDADRWRDRVQEWLRGRCFRAVMAYLKHVRMELDSSGEQARLHGTLHIAGEQKTALAIGDPERERIVVEVLRRHIARRRGKDLDDRAAVCKRLGGAHFDHWNLEPRGAFQNARRWTGAYPHLSR